MTDTGFHVPSDKLDRLPVYYGPDLTPIDDGLWTEPPIFPSGAAGLVSTIDDYMAFARLLLNEGLHDGKRLVSQRSVRLMTTNHLTPEQIATGGLILGGLGWGYGLSVAVAPDEVSSVPGRYGWNGGYGTQWFNDPTRGLVAIAMTQVSDALFNGTMTEFGKLAIDSSTES